MDFSNIDWAAVFWYAWGFMAQVVFMGAFVVQWLASEKRKRSHVPISFWYIRIAGTLMLFVFSLKVWRDGSDLSIVFVLGFCGSMVIYIRNLMLIYRRRAAFASALGDKTADSDDEER